MKALKVEIARKESAIKDFKDKVDLLNIQNETRKLSEDELEKSRDVIRRLKGEVERKDQTLRSLKGKLDSTLHDLDHVRTETYSKSQVIENNIIMEYSLNRQIWWMLTEK